VDWNNIIISIFFSAKLIIVAFEGIFVFYEGSLGVAELIGGMPIFAYLFCMVW
jgi:hypothetical protein